MSFNLSLAGRMLACWMLALAVCRCAVPLRAEEEKAQPAAAAAASVQTTEQSAQSAAAKPKAGKVDPRFASPRATVRWFLASFNGVEENPHRIDDAVACLDMSEVAPRLKDEGGRLAFELERILSWLRVPTRLIPDESEVEGTEFPLGDKPGLPIKLRRQADGRWLFDAKTVAALPAMGVTLYKQVLDTPTPKEESDVPADFQSPQMMFRAFLADVKRENYDAAGRCFDLSAIPAPARGVIGGELAVKLKKIMDRTLFVLYQDIPNTALGEPLEAVVKQEGRIVVERQPTGPRKGQWLFNRATVASIDRLYDAYESKPIVQELKALGIQEQPVSFSESHGLWLRQQLPDWLKTEVLSTRQTSLRLHQLLGLIVSVALIYPIHHLMIGLANRLARQLDLWRNGPETAPATTPDAADPADGQQAQADTELVTSWGRPLAWLVVIMLLAHGIVLLDLEQHLAGAILSVVMPLDWMIGTVFFFQLVDPAIRFVVGKHATKPGSITRAAMGFPVISLVLKFAVIGFGLSAVLELFSFDVKTVLAGLGIGGLAFALAAQDTLKNFFGSIMLIWDRTFRVGDLVQIGGHEGSIESVGLRTTRIRGLDDSLLTIPNSDLTTEHVTNYGARRYRRFRTSVGVPYDTPLEQVVRYRDGIADLVRRHPDIRSDRSVVAVNDLGDYSIEILLEVFFDVRGDREELVARDGLILDILRLAEQLGLSPTAQGKKRG